MSLELQCLGGAAILIMLLRIAHEDAVQNLVVFGALVLVLHLAGESSVVTRGAAVIYFWARAAHALAYLFAVPRVKTVAFLAGFAAQVMLAGALLARVVISPPL